MPFPHANSNLEPAHPHDIDDHVTESTPAIEDHPLGSTVNPQHSVRPGNAWGLALRDWVWELIGSVAAGLMLAFISISMSQYNTTKQTDWAINLTTLVAIISTFLRAALGFVATRILSHLAWTWFDKPHPLSHLDNLHAAARGLGGAWKLTEARIVYVPAIICLIISTATFGIGPFTQQSIRTIPCDDFVFSAGEIPVSNYINTPSFVDFPGPASYYVPVFDYDMNYMINQGFTSNTANVPSIETHSRCTAGNCKFPDYASLAICSRCLDVTSDIRSTPVPPSTKDLDLTSFNRTAFDELMNGTGANLTAFFQPNESIDLDLTAFYLPNNSTVYHAVIHPPADQGFYHRGDLAWLETRRVPRMYDGNRERWPFSIGDNEFNSAARQGITFTMLGLSGDDKKANASAAACALYPCMQSYTAAFKDNKLEEVVVSSQVLPQSDSVRGEAYAVRSPCTIDGDMYSFENNFTVPGRDLGVNGTVLLNITNQIWPVPLACLFCATGFFTSAWGDFVEGKFSDSNCTFAVGMGDYRCDKLGFEPILNNGNATFEIFRDVIANIAQAATTQVRISGKNATTTYGFCKDEELGILGVRNERRLGRGIIKGLGSQTTICYDIQWAWLTFPAGMVVAVLMLVLWAIVSTFARRSAGRPVWKSSILPLLFHGLLPPGSSGSAPVVSQTESGQGKESTRELETSTLEEKAKKLIVQLVNGEEGCGFLVVDDARDMGQGTEQAEENRHSVQQ